MRFDSKHSSRLRLHRTSCLQINFCSSKIWFQKLTVNLRRAAWTGKWRLWFNSQQISLSISEFLCVCVCVLTCVTSHKQNHHRHGENVSYISFLQVFKTINQKVPVANAHGHWLHCAPARWEERWRPPQPRKNAGYNGIRFLIKSASSFPCSMPPLLHLSAAKPNHHRQQWQPFTLTGPRRRHYRIVAAINWFHFCWILLSSNFWSQSSYLSDNFERMSWS